MIIYDKERKTLVIPEGIGCDCGGSTDCTSAVTAAFQEGYREGYLSGASTTDCSSAITEAYESGVTYQKSLLSSTAITSNGIYTSENGWNYVDVDVHTPIYHIVKQFSLESGDTSPWTVRPDHTAYMTEVIVTDNGYGQAKYNEGYLDGASATDCSSAITEAYQSGVTAGIAQQKALLGEATFIRNGSFSNHSGWSSVTVNVPREVVLGEFVGTPLSSELQNDKWYVKTFSGTQVDGWGEVRLDMSQMISYGKRKQRELFENATFTENGTYSNSATGWSSVTVNVDYSSALTNSFQSGYTSGFTDGYASAITANCGTAITEAYDSGVTVGYNSAYISASTKIAYFDQPAWVDTGDNNLFTESGMALVMEFTIGNMSSAETLHLLNNSYDGNTMSGAKPYFSIDFSYNAFTATFYDGYNGYSWNIASDGTGLRYTGDTYHLVIRTLMANHSTSIPVPLQFILINESRGEIYESNKTNIPHFGSATADGLRINCQYNEFTQQYNGMCAEWYLKFLKIYRTDDLTNREMSLAANIYWKDGSLDDSVNGGYTAYVYDNGMATAYSLPSAEDKFFNLW